MQRSQKSTPLAVPALLLCALLYPGCGPEWIVQRAAEHAGNRWDVALSSGERFEAVWLQQVTPDSLEISTDFSAEKRKSIPLDSITGLQENEIRRETRSSWRTVATIASVAAIAIGVGTIVQSKDDDDETNPERNPVRQLVGSIIVIGGAAGLIIVLTSDSSPQVYDLRGREKNEKYKIIKQAING